MVFENPEWPNYADYGLYEVKAGTKYVAYRIQGDAEISLASYLVEDVGNTRVQTPIYRSHERILGSFITAYGNEALFRTNDLGEDSAGNNFGVIAIELDEVERGRSRATRTLIEPHDRHVLVRAQRIGDFLALHYLTGALEHQVRFFDLTGRRGSFDWKPSDLDLPDRGTLSRFTGDRRSSKAHVTYSSIATPPRTLAVDLDARQVGILGPPANPSEVSKVHHELCEYQSADGTSVPVDVIAPAGLRATPRFAYLYCYGAIGIPALPAWNQRFQMILELGGLVAIVHVRGGGERGFRWQSEVKLDRTKTLEDMAAASRWLKARHPGMRVAVSGDSYGGLHALASLVRTQPDYDLVVASLPVTDIIHFLENGVFGKSAWDDFGLAHNEAGDLVKASEEIAVLKSWSPIEPDNLARLQEPIQPILMLTSDTDDRVEPEHAYVMTRALRERFMNAPVYLWAEQGIGHRVVGMEDKEITFIAAHFDIETRNDLF